MEPAQRAATTDEKKEMVRRAAAERRLCMPRRALLLESEEREVDELVRAMVEDVSSSSATGAGELEGGAMAGIARSVCLSVGPAPELKSESKSCQCHRLQ